MSLRDAGALVGAHHSTVERWVKNPDKYLDKPASDTAAPEPVAVAPAEPAEPSEPAPEAESPPWREETTPRAPRPEAQVEEEPEPMFCGACKGAVSRAANPDRCGHCRARLNWESVA